MFLQAELHCINAERVTDSTDMFSRCAERPWCHGAGERSGAFGQKVRTLRSWNKNTSELAMPSVWSKLVMVSYEATQDQEAEESNSESFQDKAWA